MSRLGNIQESYGKQVTIAVANTYSSTVLASDALPKNALIIASPVVTDSHGTHDIGTYTMLMTDNFGEAVRLTYTMQEGNGLTTEPTNPDILKLSIDGQTLTTNEKGELTIDKSNIVDGSTLILGQDRRITVNASGLTKAALNTVGTVLIDGETIKTNTSGQIYVDTQNLDKANSFQAGVVTSDNKTVNINSNGVLSVVTSKLEKATSNNVGVVKIDGRTIKTTDNTIYVDGECLERSNDYNGGVSKVDNSTIVATDGLLSANTNMFTKASGLSFGLTKIDNNTIVVNNGIASVRNYNEIISKIQSEGTAIDSLDVSTNKLIELFSGGITNTEGGIYSVTCSDTTITNLVKPDYLEEPKNMKTQHVYVSLNVITDCDFEISLTFENNETPAVELTQINYNDEFSYQGFDGLLKTYPSTGMKQKRVVLLFDCKNFKATRSKKYEKTTKITINVASVENRDICKKVLYSIVRYNSNVYINETLDEIDDNKNRLMTFIPIESESYWKEWDSLSAKKKWREEHTVDSSTVIKSPASKKKYYKMK